MSLYLLYSYNLSTKKTKAITTAPPRDKNLNQPNIFITGIHLLQNLDLNVLMGGTCSLVLCNTGASVNISRHLSLNILTRS